MKRWLGKSEACCSGTCRLWLHRQAYKNEQNWKTHPDPKMAADLYRKEILRLHETGKPLLMCMDLRSGVEEQERQLINFYNQRHVEWACPVKCQLQGDAAVGDGVTRHFFSTVLEKLKYGFSLNLGNTGVTCLFEGEPDHLVPSSSQFLIESDLFLVAGRMLGHSFLHGGPCFAGLSRAFVHVLLQGSEDTATLQLEDCPDVDIRETIDLLSGHSPLNEDQSSKVLELCLSWDLPGPTEGNRRWLYERLLSHAVLGKRTRQIKQIRRGLKETFVWNLLNERKDVAFFPKESEDSCSPEMLLSHISWHRGDDEDDDDDDDEYSPDIKERITGYLKQFIETDVCWDTRHSESFSNGSLTSSLTTALGWRTYDGWLRDASTGQWFPRWRRGPKPSRRARWSTEGRGRHAGTPGRALPFPRDPLVDRKLDRGALSSRPRGGGSPSPQAL
nr:uncharacterized protein LOC129415968 isoform X2 [Misgurnus anguillicaudatus]XP_055026170.1 uncharacterized protein LOC129415968 isoform X2 [Misgurnus anguillicaudatus]